MGHPAAGVATPSVAAPVTRRVVLQGYPVRLGKRSQQHYEELFRELSLLLISRQARPEALHAPQRLLDLVDLMTGRFTGPIEAGAQQRQEAYDRGDRTTTVVYDVAPESRDFVVAFEASMAEVDDFCRSGDLLTLATPSDLLALRSWTLGEFIRQLDGGGPTPWDGPLE